VPEAAFRADFFQASAAVVAPLLLGHWLWRRTPEGVQGGPIVEVEAYLAEDPASHSFGGCTRRNQSMFAAGGCAYVYLIYGMHHCVNAVCGPAGCGEAVLLRAIEPVAGLAVMRRRRPVARDRELTNGPAKLCAALGIDRQFDGVDLCAATSPMGLAQSPSASEFVRERGGVLTGPRIGLSRATTTPLRFYLSESAWVSHR
jgi:DNA-3-methyladenine glycosylase